MYAYVLIFFLLIVITFLFSLNIKKGKFFEYKNLVIEKMKLDSINQYSPPSELLEHQKNEIELLKIFLNFCRENNIEYRATAGTLLGLIRHQGFIPWDDDIDLALDESNIEKIKNNYSKLEEIGLSIKFVPEKNYPFKPNRSIHQLYGKQTGSYIDLFEFKEEDGLYCHKYDIQKLSFCQKEIFTKDEFENTKLYKFENIELLGPSEPYKLLRRLFGDWEELIYEPNHNFKGKKYLPNKVH